MMCFLSWTVLWSPYRIVVGINVTEHNAPIYCRTVDTDYANERSVQPHYEPWRELVFLGYFPNEVLLEVGNWAEVYGVWIVKEGKKK